MLTTLSHFIARSTQHVLPFYKLLKIQGRIRVDTQMQGHFNTVALALVVAFRRLRQYFLAHPRVVRTSLPIKQILFQPI